MLVVLAEFLLGYRALKGNENQTWVRSFVIAFITIDGTSFYGANLTDADLTGTRLKSTNLKKAILTRVRLDL